MIRKRIRLDVRRSCGHTETIYYRRKASGRGPNPAEMARLKKHRCFTCQIGKMLSPIQRIWRPIRSREVGP